MKLNLFEVGERDEMVFKGPVDWLNMVGSLSHYPNLAGLYIECMPMKGCFVFNVQGFLEQKYAHVYILQTHAFILWKITFVP